MVLTKVVEIPTELANIAREEFDCKWVHNRVTIKRFTYGDTLGIQQDCVKVKSNNMANISTDINLADLQILTLLRGVVDAPWGVNDIAAIRNLPPMIAEWLRVELDDFNTIGAKKKE